MSDQSVKWADHDANGRPLIVPCQRTAECRYCRDHAGPCSPDDITYPYNPADGPNWLTERQVP